MVVGEQGVRDPTFHEASVMRAVPISSPSLLYLSPSLKRDRYPFTAGWTGAV